MKKYILFAAVVLALNIQFAYAQTNVRDTDTLMRYYSRLATSGSEADKALLQTKLYQLLQSDQEKDWLTARRFFYQMKKIKVADSIYEAAGARFPLGQVARTKETSAIYEEKDPFKKENLYLAWIKKFPPEKFGSERIAYDYVRNSVSTAYANAGNVEKALQYANSIETPVWKGEGWAGVARVLKRKGHTKEAAELLKKAIANSYKYMTTNRNDYGAQFAATGFTSYSLMLADILVKEKKYEEALQLVKLAHDSSKNVRADVNTMYSGILLKLEKEKEAFQIIDEAMRSGQANNEMKEHMKTLYAKVKGSNEGYDEYMASLSKALATKIRKDLARQMINQPAPSFTLKDVNGNTVSLESLKGKIVVLDFWATWCGPCKRSFPAMKTAVERFKNNPDVQFLFIHTWEREDNAAASAKKFVTDNNYPFQVLMDLKDQNGINKVVEAYKVSAIPTKFVVDKKGNIRFKFTGAGGSEEVIVEELVAMIEMVGK